MTCRTCKFFVFNQNDMMGACKLNPVVVNKLPQDWCGQEIPGEFEAEVIPPAVITDLPVNQENEEKTGKRKYARKQK